MSTEFDTFIYIMLRIDEDVKAYQYENGIIYFDKDGLFVLRDIIKNILDTLIDGFANTDLAASLFLSGYGFRLPKRDMTNEQD